MAQMKIEIQVKILISIAAGQLRYLCTTEFPKSL